MEPWRTIENTQSGETFTFLETEEESGGLRVVALIKVKPDGGPPEHAHSQDEDFEIIDGSFAMRNGDQRMVLSAGERLSVKAGDWHGFRNVADQVSTLKVTVSPPADFERIMRVLCGLARDGLLPPEGPPRRPLLMMSLAQRNDYRMGPLPTPLYKAVVNTLGHLGRKACDDALVHYDRTTGPGR